MILSCLMLVFCCGYRWLTGYFAPAPEESNDANVVSGSYENGVMKIQVMPV